MKALDYNTLMALDEASIQASFPFGAIELKKGWRPAEEGEQSDRPLKQLLKDKKARQEKPRYLRASYSIPRQYVRNPDAKPDERNDNYTEIPGRALRGAGEPAEAVDEATQERFSKEAAERYKQDHSEEVARQQLRSYMGRLRQAAIARIKLGGDPSQVFEKALRELENDEPNGERRAA